MKTLILFITLWVPCALLAQVKIGDNSASINSNSLLELESTSKGFLPPRVAINSTASVAPLTGTVPAGMLVYSSGGTVADGYYYWNGTKWRLVATSEYNTTLKSANATLLKTETFVLATNNITLTLPAITASDNGMAITVKNIGSHTHLVTVQGSSSSTIDEKTNSKLTRYCSQTYVAYEGNWVVPDKQRNPDNIFDVNASGSWTTIAEVVDFLEVHMTGPAVVRLGDAEYELDATVDIDLPHAITLQGLSFASTRIVPASGFSGAPLFNCLSDSYFKMLEFDASGGSYGTGANEDAIKFAGPSTYNEVKDCTFDRFYNSINVATNAELWVFETDISNAQNNGILVHGDDAGVVVKIAETDFINCAKGVNLSKGSLATIHLASGGYYNSLGTQTAILYQPSTFSFSMMSIAGNLWNLTGKFIDGFDFSRADGRDANAKVESNAGTGDKNPNCQISVLNNASTTTLTTANTWYKGNWTNTSSATCKWTIANNRITYQPANRRNGFFTITGNLSCNNSNRTISIGIVKNGVSTVRYGETTLRITTSSHPFQFATVVYIPDIEPGDYFEVFVSSANNSDIVTLQDVQWQTTAQ